MYITGYAPSLTDLSLNHNKLETLPPSLGRTPLTKFMLEGNPLKRPPLHLVFKGLEFVQRSPFSLPVSLSLACFHSLSNSLSLSLSLSRSLSLARALSRSRSRSHSLFLARTLSVSLMHSFPLQFIFKGRECRAEMPPPPSS